MLYIGCAGFNVYAIGAPTSEPPTRCLRLHVARDTSAMFLYDTVHIASDNITNYKQLIDQLN